MGTVEPGSGQSAFHRGKRGGDGGIAAYGRALATVEATKEKTSAGPSSVRPGAAYFESRSGSRSARGISISKIPDCTTACCLSGLMRMTVARLWNGTT